MCVVSAVMGQMPGYDPKQWGQPAPQQYAFPVKDPVLAAQILDVLKRLDALDKKLELRDCSEEQVYKDKYIALLEQVANQDK